MKECNKCHIFKPLTEYYYQEKVNAKGEPYIYHRPDCKACTLLRSNQWQKDNPEKWLEKVRMDYEKPHVKERHKGYRKKYVSEGKQLRWQRNNKDKIKKYQSKKHDVSEEEWTHCKIYFNDACAYCEITYENHMKEYKEDLHKEHAINDGENDLSNCIPGCKVCNSTKKIKDYNIWYSKENLNYTDKRFARIVKWLEEDYKEYMRLK